MLGIYAKSSLKTKFNSLRVNIQEVLRRDLLPVVVPAKLGGVCHRIDEVLKKFSV